MSPIDLKSERYWGELMLALQDLQITLKLIDRVPEDRAEPDFLLDCIGIVASYCRPFTKNKQQRITGAEFIGLLTEEERLLHEKTINLRHSDHAHSDFYEGRIQLKAGDAQVWIRDGADPLNATAQDVRITHSLTRMVKMGNLTRDELRRLRMIAAKLENEINVRCMNLTTPILANRIHARYHDWFSVGREIIAERSVGADTASAESPGDDAQSGPV